MGNQQNTIVINGKRYDAVTGAMLDGPAHKSISPTKPVVDGFVKRPLRSTAVPVSRGASALQKAPVQHAKTLMRSAVKKPAKLVKPSVSTTSTAKHYSPKATIQTRTATVPSNREHLAQQVKKSSMIQKFGSPQMPSPINKRIEAMEVRPMPAHVAPPIAAITPKTKTADLLDKALEAAQSHNEPFHDPKKPLHKRIAKKIGVSSKAMAISTTVLAGLMIGGFYAYQNVPNLAMRVAAARAGFGATMPAYSPSGFAFKGPVQYSAGQVAVSFSSNTDERAYKLTQQTSSWSSDSLLNNFVAVGGKEYQTYQDRGRTIYIYDGSNATWVNGGVWYHIQGKSDLTSDQLVRIASSL